MPGLEIVLGGGHFVSRGVKDCDFTDNFTDTREVDCMVH